MVFDGHCFDVRRAIFYQLMFRGLRDYFLGVQLVLGSAELKSWYKSVLLRGFLLGVFVILAAIVIGVWWISMLGSSPWFDLGALLWVILLIFFSGAIFGLVMSMGLSFLVREKKLVQALSGTQVVSAARLKLGDHWPEVSAPFVSVFVSMIAWPFMLVPMLFPVGAGLMAWAYAREAHTTSLRMGKQYNAHLSAREPAPDRAYLLGLGLVPAALSLIPFAAFFAWPILLVSGLEQTETNDGQN